MSLGRRRPYQFVAIDRRRDNYRLTNNSDQRLRRAGSEENPVNRLDIIIVIWPVEPQMLIGQQLRMGMRHHPRMPVVRIATVHVGERRLREAEKQRKAARDCRQSPQDSFQSMFCTLGLSTGSAWVL